MVSRIRTPLNSWEWGMAQEQEEVLSSVLASLEKLVEEMEEAA
jgi:hypothetical protein